MNYRHGYHAGNFADVIKHVALVAILLHLRKKKTPFAVIDSHAGRGLYDLAGEHAARTGEAAGGIARLMSLRGDLPEPLRVYIEAVKEAGLQIYPGSPLLAAGLLRLQDRLTAVEKHPGESAILKQALLPFRNATSESGDGHVRLLKLLPPPARRGVVVIDPPFEAPDEFEILARTIAAAFRKFATGIYLVWYPVKSRAAGDAFLGEVLAAGPTRALTVEIALSPNSESMPGDRMKRAGVLVINPPYGFAAMMEAVAKIIAPSLNAVIATQWRAGAE